MLLPNSRVAAATAPPPPGSKTESEFATGQVEPFARASRRPAGVAMALRVAKYRAGQPTHTEPSARGARDLADALKAEGA
jgi:hypothetical protein